VAYTRQDAVPAGTLIATNTGPLNIGRIPLTTPLYFNGVMDELRIVAETLSPEEIAFDYGRSYRASGSLTSVLIEPPSGWSWAEFYVLDEQPPGTSIEYSILDDGGQPLMGPIYLGSDLTTLGAAAIRFHAEWSTTDPLTTPLLHEWGGVQDGPTAVTLASFTAEPGVGTITVRWETASEIGTLGFHLYRSESPAGSRARLNAELIPSQMPPGSPAGAAYTWLDEEVEPGRTYYYWLADVDIYGRATYYGPVSAVVSAWPTYSIYLPLLPIQTPPPA
jgi:hypothetical protein